ncbi:2,3-dihydroxybenzoate-AMP ligase [Parasponia andersonii]|uniref:2,3-dihydroxybenzoate-AMP ligase n=1 Tax=Parasponia andersonii TaxID=3476 RepID=A0A2P5CC52_PARAD|nr:2,3-dihydroxybenzoate-AMP ligase [Parasponia andersonii]
MSSTSTFKALNNHLKPSLRLKALCSLTLSPAKINPFLPFSHSRLLSSLHSGSLMDVLKEVAKEGSATRDGVAIRADQKSYSYKQLISSAWRISSLLSGTDLNVNNEAGKNVTPASVSGVSRHGHLGGACIGIVAKPSAEFVAGILGTWLSGGVAVPLALSYPEAELLHVMTDSDISMILSTEDHQELMQNIAAKTAAQFSLIPSVSSIYSEESAVDHLQTGAIDADGILCNTENSNENPALIVYTSGTTGKPKGVVHTHKSISAQVQTLANAWEYTSADQFLHCLPLHHILLLIHVHGLFNALLAPLYVGSTVEFLPKFSVRGIWQRWRESYPTHGKADDCITVFTGVPTMYTRLIQGYEAMDPALQETSATAAKQLRLMMCGSSALPVPVMQQWQTITGHRLLERYGMTEFVMAISNPLKGERKAGTVGKPFPGVEVRILAEDESGTDTTGVGELCVRSPSLFKEYWRLPEVTKASFTDDGFFKTGDAGKADEDGYYIILGRTSADIMKVGGYKLSALEIESVLLEHPTVEECCVLGLPDKDYGEAVSAIIVPAAEAKKREEESRPAISLEELCSWAQHKLAPYKLPTRLFLWDSLPRNAMGKVNKKEMKKKLAAEQDV